MTYDPKHEARALDALAKDMGLHDGANRDAALGLPLVMTGPDSARKVDAMLNGADLENARGYRLWSSPEGHYWEWRTLDDSYWWCALEKEWLKNYATKVGSSWSRAYAMANRPTVPPPTTKAAAVIRDEQRMADVFRAADDSVSAMRLAVEALDGIIRPLDISMRFDSATRLESAANALESAIARAKELEEDREWLRSQWERHRKALNAIAWGEYDNVAFCRRLAQDELAIGVKVANDSAAATVAALTPKEPQ